MGRIASVSSAFLIAASALTLGAADYQYQIRVRNLTYMQPFSGILLIAHTEDLDIYDLGTIASADLRDLAENGDSEAIRHALGSGVNAPYLCGLEFGTAALAPGESKTFTLGVNDDRCGDGAVLTMASMLTNTNDGFWGIDSFTLQTEGTSTIYPDALDAGTEQNNQLCTHIPGHACYDTAGNLQDGPGEGYIHVHRGFHTVNGDLAEETFDWRNPVAEVHIMEPTGWSY